MYNVELTIRDFLMNKGADTCWIDGALRIIMQGISGNTFRADRVLEQTAAVTKHGRVKRHTASVQASYPGTCRTATLNLRYTCNPNARKAHKLWITVVEG